MLRSCMVSMQVDSALGALTLEEFQRRKLRYIPLRGPLTVSVPGCVDGWNELHKRFGKLPLEKIR